MATWGGHRCQDRDAPAPRVGLLNTVTKADAVGHFTIVLLPEWLADNWT